MTADPAAEHKGSPIYGSGRSLKGDTLVAERFQMEDGLLVQIHHLTAPGPEREQGRFRLKAADTPTYEALRVSFESLGLPMQENTWGQFLFHAEKISQLVALQLAGRFNFYEERLLPGETSLLKKLYRIPEIDMSQTTPYRDRVR